MARTLDAINADIAAHEQALRDLHAEARGLTKSRNDAIIAEFDGGQSFWSISQRMKVPYSLVQGVLWRAGRTEKGRTAIQRQVRAAAQRVSA